MVPKSADSAAGKAYSTAYCHRRGHLASQCEEMHAEAASLNAALPEEAKALLMFWRSVGFVIKTEQALVGEEKDFWLGKPYERPNWVSLGRMEQEFSQYSMILKEAFWFEFERFQ